MYVLLSRLALYGEWPLMSEMNSYRGVPAEKSSARSRRRKRSLLSRIFRWSVFLLFVAVCVAGGVVGWWVMSNPPLREAATVALSGGLNPAKSFPGRSAINILLLGKDEDRDNRGQVMRTRGRTDTILLAHIDFASRRVNLLSIPRDTLAEIPGHRGKHKINAANAYGGPTLAAGAVQRLTGVRSGNYTLINYAMFEKIVDELGGVPLTVDKQLDYDDNWGNLHIHLKPGPQVLNGKQALGLVRYRHSNSGDADSDLERIARQQRLLSSLRAQIVKPENLLKLPAILMMANKGSQTTLTTAQSMCLANFARNLPPDGLRFETLPATPTRSALRMDQSEARELIRQMFF